MDKTNYSKSLMGLASLIFMIQFSGCAFFKQMAEEEENRSLYEQMGGKPVILAVVEDFTERLTSDSRMSRFFEDTEINVFKGNFFDLICEKTGGPCSYEGKDMQDAHTGMGINDEQFETFLEIFRDAMDAAQIAIDQQEKLLSIFRTMRSEIVGN